MITRKGREESLYSEHSSASGLGNLSNEIANVRIVERCWSIWVTQALHRKGDGQLSPRRCTSYCASLLMQRPLQGRVFPRNDITYYDVRKYTQPVSENYWNTFAKGINPFEVMTNYANSPRTFHGADVLGWWLLKRKLPLLSTRS